MWHLTACKISVSLLKYFYRVTELMLATLIQRYDKNHFIFSPVQKRETNRNITGCQISLWTHYVIVIQAAFKKKKMNRNVRKRPFWPVRPGPTKIQIGPRICAVWSEFSLSAWRKSVSLAIQNMPSDDSDRTGMDRLIWIFTDCACSKACLPTLRLNF